MSDLKRKAEDDSDLVSFVVGGMIYVLRKDVISRYPDSYFSNIIKPKWRPTNDEPIVIERDGVLFQYIYDYLRYGTLPRDKSGKLMVDAATRTELAEEADFYQLLELANECAEGDKEAGTTDFEDHVKSFRYVKDTIERSKGVWDSKWSIPDVVVNLPHNDNSQGEFDRSYAAFAKLVKDVVSPFCVIGKLDLSTVYGNRTVYKRSTIDQLNMKELLNDAKLSAFGKGFETVVDTHVRHSYEINLSNSKVFSPDRIIDISLLNRDRAGNTLDIRPYKLVIYKEGGHFEAHRDTVRGEEHIGTLVLILNSEYTGGELEVTHSDRTEVVTGPYSWVAMYGDCLHKINPVTSGTRVSLIYDIYCRKNRSYYHDPSSDIWKVPYYKTTPLNTIPCGADEAQKQKVIEGMHEQLRGFDSAVICLQHLYPACQANPDFLKGGDQLLYNILRDHFALAVLPCTIYRKRYDEDVRIYDDPEEDFKRSYYSVKPLFLPNGHPFHKAMAAKASHLKTNFIVFDHLTYSQVIESEQLDYTGNDAQGEETVYMVAGLQVREKV